MADPAMQPYTIQQGNAAQRHAVRDWLVGLDLLTPPVREQVVTAWVSTWLSSTHATLEAMPYSLLAPDYPLMRHVNEVTRVGLDLARRAELEWQDRSDPDTLLAILITHDVDKPLLYTREAGGQSLTPLARELPHGVIGAMLLRELGFPHPVISTVATHATNAPFHGRSLEAYLLHYADLFATDRACMRSGATPFYQRPHR